jgi:hypothetical protein
VSLCFLHRRYVSFLEDRDNEGVIDYLFKGVQTIADAGVDFLVIASNTGSDHNLCCILVISFHFLVVTN